MISDEEVKKRKQKAIETFIATFGGTYQPQIKGDIDYKLFKDGELIAYIEVTPRYRTIATAYPLLIPAARALKLADKTTGALFTLLTLKTQEIIDPSLESFIF